MDISSKDLTSLKEEIYKELRKLEQKFDFKINSQSEELSEISIKSNEKMDLIISKNTEILTQFSTQKFKLDKLNEFDSFSNKINDMVISHELRIKKSLSEIEDMKAKYDKAINDNLIVQGFIGNSSKFKNLSEYITFNINEVSRIKIEKDSLKRESKELKSKMDSVMKNLLNIGETAMLHCKEYTDNRQKNMENLVDGKLTNIDNKNLEFRLNILTNLKKLEEDFGKKFDEMLKMKNELNELMENKFKEINDLYNNLKIDVENNSSEIKNNKDEIQNIKSEIKNIKEEIKNISQSILDINNKYRYNNINMRRSMNINMSKNRNNINPIKFQQRKSIPNIPEIKTLNNLMKQLSLSNKTFENDISKKNTIYSPKKIKKPDININTVPKNSICLNVDKKNEDNSSNSSSSSLFSNKKSVDEEENKKNTSTLKLFEKMASSCEVEKNPETKNEDVIKEIDNSSCVSKKLKCTNINHIEISAKKNEEKKIIPNENKLNILNQINKLSYFKNAKKPTNKEPLVNYKLKYNFISLGSNLNIPRNSYNNNLYTLNSKKTQKIRKVNLDLALTDVFKTYKNKKREKEKGGIIGEIPIKMSPAFGRTSYGYFDKKDNLKHKSISNNKNFIRNSFSDLSKECNNNCKGKKNKLHPDKLFKSV